MTGSVKQDVNIRLALQGQESWASYREAMAQARKETSSLKQDLQEITNLGKAFQAQKIFNTPGGFYQAVNGQAFQGRMRGQRQMEMGLAGMQQLTEARETLRLATQLLGTFDKMGGILAANNVKLGTTEAELRKINSVTEARNRLIGTEIQMKDALQKNDVARINDLSRQRDILKEQVKLLEQAAREAARPSRESRIADARRNRNEFLMGDGGASLFQVQAAVSANYLMLNGLRNAVTGGVGFAVELDASLRNLQAITVTTDDNMQKLKTTIVEVSDSTKFSATEVANAAIILGQAGMSTSQIQDSIGSVALLATATGTDLSQAVDIATSTLDVFNMEASRMGHVADVMTSAVNQSKLNIDKLTLGLQYAGNTAAQSGVTFEELTAALGAMSNAGIRSGSTLGTGMRQILISLEKPSKEFQATLNRIGLSMSDVDVASKGIYGALKNLKDAGFTAADAIQSFEIRGAAAFTALSGNLDDMLAMEQGFINSTAAMRANETQMRSFSNTAKNFTSVFQSLVEVGLEPFILMARNVLAAATDLLVGFREYETTLRAVTGAVIALTSAWALMLPVRLIGYLLKMTSVSSALAGAFMSLSLVAPRLATGLGLVATAIRIMTGPIGILITALGLGVGAWMAYTSEAEKSARSLEKLRTDFDTKSGEMNEVADKIGMVESELSTLNDRYEMLSGDSDLLQTEISKVRNQFAEMGLNVDDTTTSIDQLMEQLRTLRGELREAYKIKLDATQLSLGRLIKGQEEALTENQRTLGIASRGFTGRMQNKGLSVDPVVSDMISKSLDPNISSEMVSALLASAQEKVLSVQEDATLTEDAKSTTLKFLQNVLLPALEDMEPSVIELQAARIERERRVRDGNISSQMTSPQYTTLETSIEDFQRNSSDTVGAAIDPIDAGDLVGRGNAAQAVLDAQMEQLQNLRDSVKNNVDFDPKVISELNMMLDTIEASLVEKAQPYIDAGKEEYTALSKQAMEKLNSDLKTAQSRLTDDIDNPNLLGQAVSDVRSLLMDRYMAQLRSIAVGEGSDIFKQGERDAARTALKSDLAELNNTATGIGRNLALEDAENAVKAIELEMQDLDMRRADAENASEVDALLAEYLVLNDQKSLAQQEVERLRAQSAEQRALAIQGIINQSKTAATSATEEANDQKQSMMDEAVKKLEEDIKAAEVAAKREDNRLARLLETANPQRAAEITAERVDNQAKLQDSIEALVAGAEESGVQFDGDILADALDAIAGVMDAIIDAGDSRQQDLADAAAALEQEEKDKRVQSLDLDLALAQQLFDNAIALADKAKTLEERNIILEDALRQANAILAAEAGIAGEEYTGEDLETRLKTLRAEFEERKMKIEGIRDNKLGGSKGGGGKEKSELEKYTDELDARVRAYESMIKAELLSGSTGIAQISSLVDSVKAKITEVDGQIAGMQSAVDGGQMSEENLTKLNELLAAREALTQAAAQAESMLTDQMIRQGDYWGAAKNISITWAKENLDTVDAFTKGIQNVLSTMTSGFATLFTDLANGTKSAKDAFRDFALSVVKSIQNMIAEMLAMYVMQQLIGMVFPGAQKAGSFGSFVKNWAGMAGGGEVKRMAGGGVARDSVPAMLMPGEYVMRKTAVDMIGVDNLDAMNARGNAVISNSGHKGVAKQKEKAPAFTNVYVVSPDQQPVPGPSDIIAVINDDIARGGSTKRLIKTVAMGY